MAWVRALPAPRRSAIRWDGWTVALGSLAALNLAAICIYVTVGRSWVEAHYAHARVTHPFEHHIVIEGSDFVRVSDAGFVTILAWEVVLVLTAALLRYAAVGRGRIRLREAALLGATLLAFLSVTEAGIRAYQHRTKDLPYLLPLNVFYDPVLGWKGKKVFGNTRSRKPRVLVLGDSFTDGVGVPEDSMYYAYLKRNRGLEMFVYGGGGYGTLQEYLVLDRYIDEVRPQLVVLQVCNNDFINNSYAIESASYWGNNLMVRPFLEDGVVHYRYPKVLGRARPFLANSSRLAYELFVGMDRLQFALMQKGWLPCIERRIVTGEESEKIQASVRTTGAILDRFRARLGEARLVAFTVNPEEPYRSAFAGLFRERLILFLDEPARAVAAAEARGARLRWVDGAHLNDEGNRILGETLAKNLVELGALPLRSAMTGEMSTPGALPRAPPGKEPTVNHRRRERRH